MASLTLAEANAESKRIHEQSVSDFNNSTLGRVQSGAQSVDGLLSTASQSRSSPMSQNRSSSISQTDPSALTMSMGIPRYTVDDMPYVSPPPQQQQQQQSGGSVICTKFYQLGLCEKEIYRAEHKWGIDLWKNEASGMHGYYWWGIPFARQLTRKTWQGRLLIKIMYPLFNAIALETASRYGVYRERTITTKITGKAGSFILVNFCRFMGKVRILVEGNANVASV